MVSIGNALVDPLSLFAIRSHLQASLWSLCSRSHLQHFFVLRAIQTSERIHSTEPGLHKAVLLGGLNFGVKRGSRQSAVWWRRKITPRSSTRFPPHRRGFRNLCRLQTELPCLLLPMIQLIGQRTQADLRIVPPPPASWSTLRNEALQAELTRFSRRRQSVYRHRQASTWLPWSPPMLPAS